MKDTYIDAFKSIAKSDLMTKEEMLEFLEENGEHAVSLARLSGRYTLRDACGKYGIRGKMLRQLCDYCGVPIQI